ncbi:N-carbamoylputrescine amidase [Desulfuromusa kysingii]|uniref:N-carbamoylputrescine amidase n=1 Tax=Desulfuromusa kysingii TaxID=37625 RepID=A0A1H3ZMQ6_9BACT|nr:carbon-nitrogen hydrolase [Desulfuromusa kysingii]SEA24980.1 N-carbamoylputrescine amidase [Desulfuromusa kysingii]
MSRLKTALVQQSCAANQEENVSKSCEQIRLAAAAGAELIILPELHCTPYFCQTEDLANFDLAVNVPGPITHKFAQLAEKLGIVLVISLFEKRAAGLYHNTAVVLEKDGSIAGIYRKMHIPDDPGYYEKFYFTPGDLGFTPIQTSVGKLGVLICWDQWYPEAARLMALAGAEVLIYPTAIGHDQRDDCEEQQRQTTAWMTVQQGHAIANGTPTIAVNRVGYEADPSQVTPGIHFWGNSFIAGCQGEILAQASANKEEILYGDIDLTQSEKVRKIWPFFRDRRIDQYQEILKLYREE